MRKLKTSLITAAVTGLLAASSANAWTTITPVEFNVASQTAVMSIRSKSFSDPAFGYQGWAMHGKWGVLNAVKGKSYTITVSPSSVDASGNAVTPVAGLHPAVAVYKRPIGTVANPYVYYEGAKTGFQKDASGNWVKDASGNRVPNSVANKRELTNLTEAKYVPDHNFFPVQSYINSGRSQNHVMESGPTAGTSGPTVTKTINGTDVTAPLTAFWRAALRPTSGAGAIDATTGVLLEDGATDIGFPRMLFAIAGYDADANETTIWNKLDVNPALRALKGDGSGNVAVTLKANEDAQYEFFVGGINPDAAANTSTFYPVNVAVTGW